MTAAEGGSGSGARESSGIDTICAKADHYLDLSTGAVVPPLQPSTTFARDDSYQLINPAHGYARDQGPTAIPAEAVITELEHAAECLLFASGMAAIAAVFRSTSRSATLLVPDSLYHGTRTWVERFVQETERTLVVYAGGDLESFEIEVNRSLPELAWLETPSNPMLRLMDIEACAALVHKNAGLLVVDSTVATPVHTAPLTLGADIVVHSATKALNGHSDVVAGAVVLSEPATVRLEEEVFPRLRAERAEAGAIVGAFEAWLLLRGLRTLALRVRGASNNALIVAQYLHDHERVESVLYPGLSTHPDHQLACRQMHDGFGSLLSFQVAGAPGSALKLATRLQLITSATSLGGTETLIEHRHSIEPPGSPVPENLLRLSVGIESATDLIADLDQALMSL